MAKVSDAPPTTKTIPHHFIIIVFVLLIAFSTSNCASEDYKRCSSPWTCGAMSNIGYPFWGIGRPRYCGHPALELDCGRNKSSEQPILRLSTDDQQEQYSVVAMDVSKPVISIKLQNLLGDHTCNHLVLRTTLVEFVEKQIFAYGADVNIISIFYNCKPSVTDVRNSVMCQSFTGNITGYYQGQGKHPSLVDNCGSHFEVPVLKRGIDRFNEGNETLWDVFKQGIEMAYDATDCYHCKASGGICVSTSHSTFKCWKSSVPWKLIVGSVCGGIFLLAVNVGVCYCGKFKFRKPKLFTRITSTGNMRSDIETGSIFHGIPVFSYSELHEATGNFDAARELGDGGFGIVYHGKLNDGREVAVKRLYERNYKRVGQFMNEVELLTNLRHPNLVTLYGCTSRHSRELLLVYEYVSNGTVADHLYGGRSSSGALTWATRMMIAVETATALSYLHTSDIVHRDVKTNNILLDNNFSVKVADFGLSRLFPTDVTHVSTAPQGTPGYLDPEYNKCYQVTNKSDVYSFGVVLVELISSLPAVDINRQNHEINLSDYAVNRIQKGLVIELVDQSLGFQSDFKTRRMITLVAELAFQCLQQEKEVRPNMSEVFEALKRIENLDYAALEAAERDGTISVSKPTYVVVDTDKPPPPSPSSVIDNWAIRSSSSTISN